MPRYPDFARACLKGHCEFPGYLEDVSKTGCKVRFAQDFGIDLENEYTLTILPGFRSGIKEFELTVCPQWVENGTDSCEIGFQVLHSPGIRHYARYVDILAEQGEEELQEA